MQKQLLLIALLMSGTLKPAAVSAEAAKKQVEGATDAQLANLLVTVDTSKIFSKAAAAKEDVKEATMMFKKLVDQYNQWTTLMHKILISGTPNHRLSNEDWGLIECSESSVLTEDVRDKFKFLIAKAWRKQHGKATGPATADEAHQN